MSDQDIINMIDKMEKNVETIKKNVYELALNASGSVGIDELFNMSQKDRNLIIEVINKQIKERNDALKKK